MESDRIYFEIVITLVLISLVNLTSASSVTVEAPFGKIKGEILSAEENGQSYVVFRNIPYARPPVEDLRFSKPEPHPKLDDIFDATNKRTMLCIHPDAMLYGYEQGSEDCLILNVFAKEINPDNELKKVMVFIHGGGFIVGGSNFYNMTYFTTTHDIVSVTINYRLGVLGFLSTGNEASPGNYGLWDQALALKWVKDNIQAFGGDPNAITISGESAGGASVSYQTLTPVTKGLFSRACPQSGTATSVFAEDLDVQRHALTIAKNAKCWDGEITEKLDLEQSERLIKCLRSVDTSVLSPFDEFTVSEAQFVPTVDGEFVPKKPSLLLQDESYLESIGFYDRSYLVSIVNNEFAIMATFFDQVKGMILSSNETTDEEKKGSISQLLDGITNFYLRSRLNNDNVPSSNKADITDFYTRRNVEDDAVMDMVTDLSFLIPSYDFLNAASKRSSAKTWFLYFNHFPAFMKGKYKGTVHGVDLLYWHDLQMEIMDSILNVGMAGNMDSGDLQLKTLYSSILADFVNNGDPGTSAAFKEMVPSGWPEYDSENAHYLDFNLAPFVRKHLEREKRDLWLKKVPSWTSKTHERTEL